MHLCAAATLASYWISGVFDLSVTSALEELEEKQNAFGRSMSAFTESALLKKLGELNSSQQSIQTLSLWLIHHRKHHAVIVKTWLRELQNNVSESKKLTFMYLANDVIQNSKKKGPEYGKEFSHVLPAAFTLIAESCTSEKLIGSLGRILNIWGERGVYDAKTIGDYRARLKKEMKGNGAATETGPVKASIGEGGTPPPPATSKPEKQEREKPDREKHEREKHEREKHEREKHEREKHDREKHEREKRKHHHHEESKKAKRTRTGASNATAEGSLKAEGNEQNGEQAEQLKSPYMPLGEPPEPDELIRALTNIENSASSDAVVRERIANLPPEISEINCLSKLEDKDAAKALAKQVNEAVQLLNDYNARLAAEMEERTKLAAMLRDFQAEQKELLAQAEQRLDEYKKKLSKMMAVQKEIKDHLSNLPDLTQLPDVTGGLAPLPSAGDLFNIH